jgi:hypothetical protein
MSHVLHVARLQRVSTGGVMAGGRISGAVLSAVIAFHMSAMTVVIVSLW